MNLEPSSRCEPMTPRLSEINLSIDTTLDTEGALHES